MRRGTTLVGSIVVLAVAAAAIPLWIRRGPSTHSSPSKPMWPHSEGRLFGMASKEAWRLVQQRLTEVGVAAEQVDHASQLLISRWVEFGDGRFGWLPRPKLPGAYEPVRVRFEVFVSAFVEPARLYVGSLAVVRRKEGRGSEAVVYNDPTLNQALLRELAKGLGQDGFQIPLSREGRRELAAALLKDTPDQCVQPVEPCESRSGRVQKPEKLPLSVFEVSFPQAAAKQGAVAPLIVELNVSEDGAVVGGRVIGSPRGQQLEASAAGATSLLVFSPLRMCGCPAPHISLYTIEDRNR